MEMQNLSEIEREIWIKFHEFAYKDDLKLAETIKETTPRWSIIAGYYAMHDIAKLYLGKVHNIKISGKFIHAKTILAFKKVFEGKEEQERILKLLEEADREIKEIGAEQIPYLLSAGKTERGKSQYYPSKVLTDNEEYKKKANCFFDSIVKVFINIMEKLIC